MPPGLVKNVGNFAVVANYVLVGEPNLFWGKRRIEYDFIVQSAGGGYDHFLCLKGAITRRRCSDGTDNCLWALLNRRHWSR